MKAFQTTKMTHIQQIKWKKKNHSKDLENAGYVNHNMESMAQVQPAKMKKEICIDSKKSTRCSVVFD